MRARSRACSRTRARSSRRPTSRARRSSSRKKTARCAREGGELGIELRALCASVSGHLQLGDRAATEAAYGEFRSHAEQGGIGYATASLRGIEAMFHLLDGRFAEARTAIDESERAARAIGSGGLVAQTTGQRFWLAVEEGRVADARPLLVAVLDRYPDIQQPLAALALADAVRGDVEAARAALAKLVPRLPEHPLNWARLPTLVFAAEAAYRAEARAAALAIERELAPYAAISAVAATGALYHGSVAHALGLLAAASGRQREAIGLFERGLAVHQAMRSPPWIERSQRAIGEAKSRRGLRAV